MKKRKLKVLVTAGPTQERIDPVRFISNRSTGVMGYEIAKAARKKGHKVTLISGPTHLKPPAGAKIVFIKTVDELKKATLSYLKSSDCLFMVAAVCDWRVAKFHTGKIKRLSRTLKLLLQPTPDILAIAGKRKGKRILVGFSLETKGAVAGSKRKLKKKNLDLIVSNLLKKNSEPFGNKRVKSSIIYRTGKAERLPFLSKERIARLLVARVEELCQEKFMVAYPRS